MTTLLKPSTLIHKGLRVEQINNLTLFKFTEELGDRLQILLDKQKDNSLNPDETIELESITNRWLLRLIQDRLQYLWSQSIGFSFITNIIHRLLESMGGILSVNCSNSQD